ncbi:MAG: amino acid adenylation domain-containing protein, partial [Syntrophothermus sp.]
MSRTIHSAFEEQVRKTPWRSAVNYAGNELSYFRLNRMSNLLALQLIKAGVKPETRVGIYLERSVETVISIFGILKAGGCYIPLDASYPEARIKAVINESQMQYLITTDQLKHSVTNHDINIINIGSLNNIPESEQADDPRISVYPDNCAYIIYTSGSTGTPKGVMVRHSSVLNLFNGLNKTVYSDFSGKLFNASLNAPVSFDASVQQLVMLLGGHTLHILPDEVRTSDTALASFIADNAIDVLDCVPSQLKFLMDIWSETEGIKKPLICLPGGEAIEEQLWNRISELKETKFFNMYGPTECTVDSTACEVSPSNVRPVIGRPLENISVYILDKQMQLQPPGIAGEIYIGEPALARGYADKPALTAEFFLPDPFSSLPGSRLYRSGDAGRFLSDGSIEYLGRTDNQVKIKGFRIELGDIESALQSHPDIKNAAVIVREDTPGLKRLTAYVVFASPENSVNVTELISYLKLRLPDYMVPHIFVALDILPLTPSGKTDRLRLPRPEMQRPAVSSGFNPAQTGNEIILLDVFREVLGLQAVGIDDNFFELGGDSIISIQAVTKARQKGLNITAKNIFQFPTIRELAALSPSSQPVREKRLRPGDEIELSPVQKWFFSKNFPHPDHWNQSVFIEIADDISRDLLEKSFNHIINFHESFSFRFNHSGDEWKQFYIPSGSYAEIKEYDLSGFSKEISAQRVYAESIRLQSSLDIHKGPLFTIALFREPDRRLLFIALHHLIVDGITWRMILEDMQNVYIQLSEGKTASLPPVTAPYAVWTSLLSHNLPGNILDRSLSYFSSLPAEKLRALPRDFENGLNLEQYSSSVIMSLTEEETGMLLVKLNEFPGFSVQDILLASVAKTLGAWTGSEDLFIDMESHGREEIFPGIDISRTAGWFTSIFPVHLKTDVNKTSYERLTSVHSKMDNLPSFIYDFRIPGNGMGLEEKFSALNNIEISFNYLGRLDQHIKGGSIFKSLIKNKTVDRSHSCSRIYLLDIAFELSNGRLNSCWTFSSGVHNDSTIEKVAS